MNDVAHSKASKTEIADQPQNDQNDSYSIKKISHVKDKVLGDGDDGNTSNLMPGMKHSFLTP